MKPSLLDRSFKYFPGVSLALLLFYLFAYTFLNPYLGFYYQNRTYEVITMHVASSEIQVGDVLISIAGQDMLSFHDDPFKPLLSDTQVGDQIDLLVVRDGQQLEIAWTYPGMTTSAIIDRFWNIHLLSILFWAIGFIAYVFIRPRDTLWKLLIAFNFITALWFVTGATAKFHYFLTPIMFRATLWLAVPIYLHLHWNFPKPLITPPKRFWPFTYLAFTLIALSQFFVVLPESLHLSVFFVAIVVSIGFAIAHYALRPEERHAIRVLVWAILISFIALLPLVAATVLNTSTNTIGGVLFALPIIPAAYFYAIFRHRLSGLGLRANRALSIYLFIFIAATLTSVITPLMLNWFDFPGGITLTVMTIGMTMVVLAIFGFHRFERFVEERVLGIPLPPEELMHSYARKITSSLDRDGLNNVLSETVLPSMQIRQSCLLYLDKLEGWQSILEFGIDDQKKVQASQIHTLLEETGLYIPIPLKNESASELDWVRLALPLHIKETVFGIWLFGRRDPEDFYSQRDIVFLQTLANQTSIALANISLARDLRALYMANVKRQEDEKEHIARELHDDVLNELAVLSMKMDGSVSQEFQRDYQNLTDRIRNTVQDLRPPMLNHGLHTALEELGETLNKRSDNGVEIEVTIPPSSHRIDEDVEAHLFRIVQQACENAIRHAEAKNIFVSGSIEKKAIELEVSDNGKGFVIDSQFNLAGLLAKKHYGIASMVERAELVGAHLKIDSSANSGTSISVHWTPS